LIVAEKLFAHKKPKPQKIKKLKLKEKMKSWVKYSKETDFPIQNLPYGIFKPGTKAKPRVGVAIGDYVLDLSAVSKAVDVRSITLSMSYVELSFRSQFVCVCVEWIGFLTFFRVYRSN
jgi:hypothetical protein